MTRSAPDPGATDGRPETLTAGRFRIDIHPGLGARWSSLRDEAGREWLWRRDEAGDRGAARPGGPFIDVGGAEECFPTIDGRWDHGDAWSRPWRRDGEWLTVETDEATLSRRIGSDGAAVVLDYRVEGNPGYGFIWAFHALLDPAPGTRVVAPHGHRAVAWPGDEYPVETSWPAPLGIEDYAHLGRDDGTALFVVLPELDELAVEQAGRRLRFRLEVEDQPHGFAVWRNLGGYPWSGGDRFRNFGIEPMLGAGLDRDRAPDRDLARLGPSGALAWRLRLLP